MTKEISVQIPKINPFKLDEDVKALTSEYYGHKTGDGKVTLLFSENVSQEMMEQAADIAFNHDPKVLTVQQALEKDKRDTAAVLREQLAGMKNDPVAAALALLLEKYNP